VPMSFRDMAELHSDVALFLVGMTLATLFALHLAKAPASVQRRARTMLEILFVQGVVGYTQYFLHDNPLLVEIHLAGATSAWAAAVLFYLSLTRRPGVAPHAGLTAGAAPRVSGRPASRVAVNAPA
jgi:cytochrome c oxidase assembly protein subunit 15